MKKIKLLILLLVVLQTNFITAQKVSNINYRQEQSNIIVSYDLETKTPCKVNLFVSTNGGASWQGPLTKVTGDVGNKITSGSRNITWKVLEEFEELRGDKIQFQVRADGDTIETIFIGTQEWTKKNLDVSTYRNGDEIPQVQNQYEWAKLTTGAWCYYNNDPLTGAIYGKLYNWYAVNDPRGLAPKGFHISTHAELDMVKDLKDPAGFAGLPGGCRNINGPSYLGFGSTGYWWSSLGYDTANAWCSWSNYLHTNNGGAYSGNANKTAGFSVRCLRD